MQRIQNPLPLFFDQHGALLDAGFIYIGTADDDPETSPVGVFWDPNLTIPAAQPLRTRGGVLVNNGSPAIVYVAEPDYSMRTRDADGNLVSYFPSATETGGVGYQPLDSDLSAIAAAGTTAYGISLLGAFNAAALRALAGIVDSLAKTGGTVTGNIVRQGAGPHLYHVSGFASGRVFVTPNNAADPTSQVGDIWIKYTP